MGDASIDTNLPFTFESGAPIHLSGVTILIANAILLVPFALVRVGEIEACFSACVRLEGALQVVANLVGEVGG